jgi:hypothetical protein
MRAKAAVDPKDQLARFQLEQATRKLIGEGDAYGVAWREAPLNIGQILTTHEFFMATEMAHMKITNVCLPARFR